jgi:phytoene dehydrogenase-like protein
MIVSQMSVYDKKRAPEGKAVLWVTVRTVPYEIKGDSAGKIRGSDWNKIKEKYVERVINIIDSYTENFKNSIINFQIQTPIDVERNNLNLVKGDITAGSHHFDQSFIFRPYPSLKPYRTPFKGLYMTGSATFPGAGINGASGRITAQVVCKELGISIKKVFRRE